MSVALAILGGVACGVAVATPLALQLGRDEPDLGHGFGWLIVAFVAVQALMFAVMHLWPSSLAPFGVSATLSYLACVVGAALRRR